MSEKKNHSSINTKTLLFSICAVCAGGAGGGMVFMWWSNPTNPFLGLAAIILLAVAVWLGWTLFKPSDSRVVASGGKKVNINANVLNIYANVDDNGNHYAENIEFDYHDNPQGQLWQCMNNGKHYRVNIWDLKLKRLVPFTLPDAKYVDPAFMARYLELPAQRKYLRHHDTMMKYIGPGILALLDVAGFIAIIALSG